MVKGTLDRVVDPVAINPNGLKPVSNRTTPVGKLDLLGLVAKAPRLYETFMYFDKKKQKIKHECVDANF